MITAGDEASDASEALPEVLVFRFRESGSFSGQSAYGWPSVFGPD